MAAIDVLGAMYGKRKDAKRVMEAEHRILLDKKLESLDRELGDMVVRAYRDEKAPIARIAREMGCSRTLVYKMIEDHAAIESAFGPIDPLAHRFAFEDDCIRVTLTEEEVMAEAKNRGQRYPEGIDPTGLFEGDGRGGWIYAERTDEPQPLTHGYLHPVRLWSWDDANLKQLADWAKEHAPKVAAPAPTPVEAVNWTPTYDADDNDDSWEQAA